MNDRRRDYPEPPSGLVDAAERDLPAVLQEIPNEAGNGAIGPGHGHRVVLADQVGELARVAVGHEVRLRFRIEVGGGKPVPADVVERLNDILAEVSKELKLG